MQWCLWICSLCNTSRLFTTICFSCSYQLSFCVYPSTIIQYTHIQTRHHIYLYPNSYQNEESQEPPKHIFYSTYNYITNNIYLIIKNILHLFSHYSFESHTISSPSSSFTSLTLSSSSLPSFSLFHPLLPPPSLFSPSILPDTPQTDFQQRQFLVSNSQIPAVLDPFCSKIWLSHMTDAPSYWVTQCCVISRWIWHPIVSRSDLCRTRDLIGLWIISTVRNARASSKPTHDLAILSFQSCLPQPPFSYVHLPEAAQHNIQASIRANLLQQRH